MGLIDGSDAVLDDVFPYQVVNKIKDHWYGPTPPSDPQDGMIWVKNDGTSYFYHNAAWYPMGRIAQVVVSTYDTVATKSTGFPDDDTIPQITEGDEILSCAITPQNASSIILIFFTTHTRRSTNFAIACLFKSGSNDALQVQVITISYASGGTSIYTESAGNTNARTYSVRVGDSSGNNIFVNDAPEPGGSKFGAVEKCRLIVMEVLP